MPFSTEERAATCTGRASILAAIVLAFLVKWQLGRNGKMQNNELLRATLTLRLLSWVYNKFNLSTMYFRKKWVIKLDAFY